MMEKNILISHKELPAQARLHSERSAHRQRAEVHGGLRAGHGGEGGRGQGPGEL